MPASEWNEVWPENEELSPINDTTSIVSARVAIVPEEQPSSVNTDERDTIHALRLEMLHRTSSMMVVLMGCITILLLYIDTMRTEIRRIREDIRIPR